MRILAWGMAFLASASAVQAQEAPSRLWLFAPEHAVRFEDGRSDFAQTSAATAQAMNMVMNSFANRGDLRVVLIASPQDKLADARFRAATALLRSQGAWPAQASRGIETRRDPRTPPSQIRLGLTSASNSGHCPVTLEISLPSAFGEQSLALTIARPLALPQEARITARFGAQTQGPFAPPMRVHLSEEGLLTLDEEGAKGSGDQLGPYGVYQRPPPPPPADQFGAASRGSGDYLGAPQVYLPPPPPAPRNILGASDLGLAKAAGGCEAVLTLL